MGGAMELVLNVPAPKASVSLQQNVSRSDSAQWEIQVFQLLSAVGPGIVVVGIGIGIGIVIAIVIDIVIADEIVILSSTSYLVRRGGSWK